MDDRIPEDICKKLTEREQEIFLLMQNGCSNAEIAKLLYITVNTVEKHTYNILQKLRNSDGGGDLPPANTGVPRRPRPSGDGNMAEEELPSLLMRRLADI